MLSRAGMAAALAASVWMDHPDSPADEPPFVVELSVVSPPALPFVTVDLTRRADGVWRVVELGDGQGERQAVVMGSGPVGACLGRPGRIDGR